ncbi:MAG: aldo/keto reductase [Sphingobium sp.]
MEMRKLGANGPQISAIGLGCMRMTPLTVQGGWTGKAEGIATIHAALDAGVTLINTGDFYSMGANEALVGEVLRDRRDKAFVSVKFGAMRSPSGQFLGFDARPNAIKNFCSYSLQRLGVEVIDLYQPARIDPGVPVEDTIGAVADLIKEGKVRYLGVSEYNADQLRRAHAVHPVTALEIEYSLASRFIEPEILPTARELGVGVIPYSVVTQGLLTGTLSTDLPADDTRRMFPRFQGDNLAKNMAAVDALRAIAERKGATPAQIAVAWVLAQGDDLVPLVGMSNRSRLPENLGALDLDLTPEDLADLDRAFAPGAIAGSRYPEGLRGNVAS